MAAINATVTSSPCGASAAHAVPTSLTVSPKPAATYYEIVTGAMDALRTMRS